MRDPLAVPAPPRRAHGRAPPGSLPRPGGEAEAAAEAGRIAGACQREMHDLISAALGNLRRIDQMEPSRAAREAVPGALGRPRPPRRREDDADA